MKGALLGAWLGFVVGPCLADTIHVDADPGHSTNTIRPTEALGAGVDRLPYGAADKLFNPATSASRFTLPAASVTVLRGHVILPAAN
jgi:hypothetical protein